MSLKMDQKIKKPTYIKEWLDYQNILHQIQIEEKISKINYEKLRKKLDLNQPDDLDKSVSLITEKLKKSQNFAYTRYSNLNPESERLLKIKQLWLEILNTFMNEIDLDIGDYEEMGGILDQIEELNDAVEQDTFDYFIYKNQISVYVLDWINYKKIKQNILEIETDLAKQHVSQISKMDSPSNDLIQEEFNQFITIETNSKLDILIQFHAQTPELKLIIEKQKEMMSVKKSQNLNLIQNSSLKTEYQNFQDNHQREIKELTVAFEQKALQIMREIES